MTPASGATVVLRRMWWRTSAKAVYRLAGVVRAAWDTRGGWLVPKDPNGGAPRLWVYVRCDAAVEGRVNHSCRHGDPPHQIKCVVLAEDNVPAVYDRLAALAGPRPVEAAEGGGAR